MSDWARLAELPLRVEGYELEPLSHDVSSAFTRETTVVRLHGDGHEGVGEDVTYDAVDQELMRAAGPVLALEGSWTLGSFTEHVARLDLFGEEPQREVSRLYRRWTYDSAALDLALRQAGAPLHELLGRPARPLSFVISLRLGEPPDIEAVRSRLAHYPDMRFKLDPTSSWTEELIAELAATEAVDSVDFKGLYAGTIVDQPADPVLYRRVIEGLPDAWIEDPAPAEEVQGLLAAHLDRVTWDAPLHSVADIEALSARPRMINVKPSRLGGLRSLLEVYAYCEREGIGAYGGGQFELGPGRGQIEYLASIFHSDTPNDVAPSGYHDPDPAPGLPTSPMEPRPSPTGFRWGTPA